MMCVVCLHMCVSQMLLEGSRNHAVEHCCHPILDLSVQVVTHVPSVVALVVICPCPFLVLFTMLNENDLCFKHTWLLIFLTMYVFIRNFW
jgi:ABC-type methionine transport system permease subunit